MKVLAVISWAFSIAVAERRLVLNAGDLAGEIYTGLLEQAREPLPTEGP